ncbi:MAG: fibronectin type III domain-containing protein [Bacteroidales bacterium]|nr:fibronectin type III domain-containing protein [Bacteroidales bacterium]
MKKTLFALMCLAVLIVAGTGLKAQEVTITLKPGWNWISYPNAEVMGIKAAFGDFEPSLGEIVKSKENGQSTWNNVLWLGALKNLVPGQGYMYYSSHAEVVNFVFAKPNSSEVTTLTPTDITAVSAVVGCDVTVEQGNHIFARGLCWGMEPNLTLDGDHIAGETVAGEQNFTLDGLTPNTTYYVRSYMVCDKGLVYGSELSFVTYREDTAPTGAINGLFTVNNQGNQVYFSQGNLQYIGSASSPYWQFAENQWEVLGTITGQNSNSHTVDRDLFGWGTSGWDCGNSCFNPWETYNSTGASYGPLGANNLTGSYANSDWGVYNSIANGGNQPGLWRTPTKDEWAYLFETRTTASGIRYAKATVNDVNGVILLPDDWNAACYDLNDTNTTTASFASNTISAAEWTVLEQYGAVFLPATGYRFGTMVSSMGNGYYWSSSFVNSSYAYGVYFPDSNLKPQDCSNRTYGRGIRLMYPVQ